MIRTRLLTRGLLGLLPKLVGGLLQGIRSSTQILRRLAVLLRRRLGLSLLSRLGRLACLLASLLGLLGGLSHLS